MSDLAIFQDRFSRGLHENGDLTLSGDAETLRIGLSIHRNTIYKALIDALRANYPTVERLVGDEWFLASAHAFLEGNLPQEPSLNAFGAAYPDFLSTLPAAADMPYLPGVARIDRFWSESHIAADADVLSPEAFTGIPFDSLFDLKLRLHPSVRLGWFGEPAPSIWKLNRPPSSATEQVDLDWAAEGALIARPHSEVIMKVLDAPSFAFLEKCSAGATLGQAATSVLDIDPSAGLMTRIAELIALGAFMSFVPTHADKRGDHQ
jgi:hypothetical protein